MNVASELNKIWRELRALRLELEHRKPGPAAAPAPAPPLPEVLSLRDAAKRLACSERTLRRMVQAGELVTVRVGDTPKVPASEIRRIAQPGAPVLRSKRGGRAEPAPRGYSVAEEKARLAVLRAQRKGPASKLVAEALRQKREAARAPKGPPGPSEGGES